MEKYDDDVNHVMRNGLTVIQKLLNQQWRIIDVVLGRCKEMEDELNKLREDRELDSFSNLNGSDIDA